MSVFVTGASGSSGQLAERVEIDNATDSLRSMIMQRTASSRDSQLDAVVGEEAQYGADRAQLLEQVENEAGHGAHLLVRVHRPLPGRTAHQPGRQPHRQLAAAGLGDPPGPHPLPDQVQLSLADRALEAQQQPVIVLGRVVDPLACAATKGAVEAMALIVARELGGRDFLAWAFGGDRRGGLQIPVDARVPWEQRWPSWREARPAAAAARPSSRSRNPEAPDWQQNNPLNAERMTMLISGVFG